MPTIKDDAICIRRWDFSETSQTVSLVTREHGVIRGLAKGAKRERGSFSGGLDVLTRGQIVASVKPGRELSTLTQWSLQRTYPVLRRRLAANRTAWYMADLVHHLLHDQDPHPGVFDALESSLDRLEAEQPPARVLLPFQWALLRDCGYEPQLGRDAETGGPLPDGPTLAFSARAGGIVADSGGPDRWRVRTETVALLRAVARGELPDDADEAIVDRANRLLATYLRELIGRETAGMKYAFGEL